MKILLDHNIPRRLGPLLRGHAVSTTRAMGWEKLVNGVLLDTASKAGFEAFLSVDKNLEHQQNLRKLPLPVIVIDSSSNALPAIVSFVPILLEVCGRRLDRALFVLEQNGTVLRLIEPH